MEHDDQDDTSSIQELTLAELHYENGVRVVFSYDESSGDYGLLQEGMIGSAPIVRVPVESLLAAFLEITPEHVPVPELLLAEPPPEVEGSRAPRHGETSQSSWMAGSVQIPSSARASSSCP
jgi:hypothetical protein